MEIILNLGVHGAKKVKNHWYRTKIVKRKKPNQILMNNGFWLSLPRAEHTKDEKYYSWSQSSYNRNVVFKMSKLVLNSLTVCYFNLDCTYYCMLIEVTNRQGLKD